MAAVRRQEPLVLQVARKYEEKITSGEIRPGDQLPTVQQIAADEGVSTATAGRAIKYLAAAQLVTTSRAGTTAGPRRLVPGPQQRAEMAVLPRAETVMLTAGAPGLLHVPAPGYVADILDLPGDGPRPGGAHWVIRREQVHYELGPSGLEQVPFMLSVQWFPDRLGAEVPELLGMDPISGPGGAIELIGERTGEYAVLGRSAREARTILDDGREGPLLRVPAGYVVLAETYLWVTPKAVLEYGEYVLIQGRVTVSEYAAR